MSCACRRVHGGAAHPSMYNFESWLALVSDLRRFRLLHTRQRPLTRLLIALAGSSSFCSRFLPLRAAASHWTRRFISQSRGAHAPGSRPSYSQVQSMPDVARVDTSGAEPKFLLKGEHPAAAAHTEHFQAMATYYVRMCPAAGRVPPGTHLITQSTPPGQPLPDSLTLSASDSKPPPLRVIS